MLTTEMDRNPEGRRPSPRLFHYEVMRVEISDRVLPSDAILAPVGFRDPHRWPTQMYGVNGGTSNPFSVTVKFSGQKLEELGCTDYVAREKDGPQVAVFPLGPNSKVIFNEAEHTILVRPEDSKQATEIRPEDFGTQGFIFSDPQPAEAAGLSVHRWRNDDYVEMGEAKVYVTGNEHQPPPKISKEVVLQIEPHEWDSPLAEEGKQRETEVVITGPWQVIEHYLKRGYIVAPDRIIDLDEVERNRQSAMHQAA